jgi:hypothetical protein
MARGIPTEYYTDFLSDTTRRAGYGFDLAVVYAGWILTLMMLYPAARWFASLKRRRRDWWLSYF